MSNRTIATRAALVGAAATAALALSATQNAYAFDGWVGLSTSHGVGIYNQANSESGKGGAGDLWRANGDRVHVACWTRGEDIDSQGNVWYSIDQAYYGASDSYYIPGQRKYVYGAYVDGNAAFHAGVLRLC